MLDIGMPRHDVVHALIDALQSAGSDPSHQADAARPATGASSLTEPAPGHVPTSTPT